MPRIAAQKWTESWKYVHGGVYIDFSKKLWIFGQKQVHFSEKLGKVKRSFDKVWEILGEMIIHCTTLKHFFWSLEIFASLWN